MPRRDQVKDGLLEWQVVAADAPDLEQIVDEVEYALYPPKHEGKLPTYSCIITASTAKTSAASTGYGSSDLSTPYVDTTRGPDRYVAGPGLPVDVGP